MSGLLQQLKAMRVQPKTEGGRVRALLIACGLLFVGAIVLTFWAVLSPNVVFVAPDAPILVPTFRAAWHHLWSSPPTLLSCLNLLPFGFAYEGTFWMDAAVMGLAGIFALRGAKVPWGAACVGGFAAAFAGYFFTLFCAGHRGVVDALAVTSLAFGTLRRALDTGHFRWFALLGVLLAFGLGAQADIWLLVVLLLGAYALWLLWEARQTLKQRGRKLLCGALLTALVFLVVGLPALRHTFGAAQSTRTTQLAQASQGASSPTELRSAKWRFTTDWSLPPEDLLELLVPAIHGRTSYPFDPTPYTGRMGADHQTLRQHTIHLGWLTLILACLAFLPYSGRTRERWFWLGAAGVTLVLALGRYTPLYQLVWELPFINQIRAPVKWFHLTGFALAMLAGFGAVPLVRRWGVPMALVLCAGIALNGALVARPYVFPIDLNPTETLDRLPPRTTVLAQPNLHDWIRAAGMRPTTNPAEARILLRLVPSERGFKAVLWGI